MRLIVLFLLLLSVLPAGAQNLPGTAQAARFSRQDSLRGALTPLRACYDVGYYNLNVRVNPADSTIRGNNTIVYTATADFRQFQLDLFPNMEISRITYRGQPVAYKREASAVFVTFPDLQKRGAVDSLTVHYGGKPPAAKNAPWDGGFVWARDKTGQPWIGTAIEGIGASVWWPGKDHPSDEPDSMAISCEVPSPLVCISNGNLIRKSTGPDGFTRYEWKVSYPINAYNVTLNIGRYTHFSDTYTAADGDTLRLDYYVMPYNEKKARQQFAQVKPMLTCFEKYFGKYPFWRDGYALVETPYLGMEHQSAIAYGNNYQKGYMGRDLSGVGLGFDYIIVHESAHEYWGNSVTAADHADMWIQESFTTYAEALYVECTLGYETALRYLQGEARLIQNLEPVQGPPEVGFNNWVTSDHYFKGSLMLHTLRNAIGDDKLWFEILYGLSQTFRHKAIRTQNIVDYINTRTGRNFNPFFEQYLNHPELPVLQYKLTPRKNEVQISYRWEVKAAGFAMPVKVRASGKEYTTLIPTAKWQTATLKGRAGDFRVASDLFYIRTQEQTAEKN
jgi:aminopeptidase N